MQATIFGSMQMKRTFLDNMEVKKAHFDSPESQGLLSHKAQLKSMAMPNIMGAGIVPRSFVAKAWMVTAIVA